MYFDSPRELYDLKNNNIGVVGTKNKVVHFQNNTKTLQKHNGKYVKQT